MTVPDSGGTPTVEAQLNMWEELNRPGPDKGEPVDQPPPPTIEVATTTDGKDPIQLLLAGALAFVSVVGTLMVFVGSGDAPTVVATTAAAVAEGVPQSSDQLAFQAEEVGEAPEPVVDLGVPAELLDSEQSKVFRLYLAAFGRAPDSEGFEFWTQQVRDGTSLHQVAATFAGSDEFRGQLGSDPGDEEIVQALYQNILGRPGDDGGVEFWVGQRVGGLTIEQLLVEFSESAESVAATGTRP